MDDIWNISFWEIAIRLLLAAVLGGLVGWERERNNHPAGFRTHILVSVGAALIMLLSIYGFSDFNDHPNVRFDPARLAAQVISGIGFLGAGTILRHGISVSGLTTAASLWVVAGIGLAAGANFMFGAILTTVIVLVSLELLNRLEGILVRKRHLRKLDVIVNDQPGILGDLVAFIDSNGGSVRKVNMEEGDDNTLNISFIIRFFDSTSITILCEEARKVKGVKSVRTEQ
ncbi:MgtC/SapB family protein [Hazenella sp. IB182357]|uniref:MgtC/SapB family protein n=1 Tax=Polycladospora coralii TaxID=2771432 RepID=A0A926RU25_9BACL|nr:MgtC/SapB family protein [Polycladospora coralii]MBD1372403.1 MgtC/SapB family protein [Polycladospora coralii]MBS7531407.1 MgtC/SapB family protein [Polycladospora coralii]